MTSNNFESKILYDEAVCRDEPAAWVESLNQDLQEKRGLLPGASQGRKAPFMYMLRREKKNGREKIFAILTGIGTGETPQAPNKSKVWNPPVGRDASANWERVGDDLSTPQDLTTEEVQAQMAKL